MGSNDKMDLSQKLMLWAILAGVAVFVGGAVRSAVRDYLVMREAFPEPPELSDLARSTQTLDEKSAIALAEEFLDRERRTDITSKAPTLEGDARGRVFTLRGAHSASKVDPKRVPYPATLCLLRGAEGWLVWESGATGCSFAGMAPPGYRARADAKLCAEIAALGGGAEPPHPSWNCGT